MFSVTYYYSITFIAVICSIHFNAILSPSFFDGSKKDYGLENIYRFITFKGKKQSIFDFLIKLLLTFEYLAFLFMFYTRIGIGFLCFCYFAVFYIPLGMVPLPLYVFCLISFLFSFSVALSFCLLMKISFFNSRLRSVIGAKAFTGFIGDKPGSKGAYRLLSVATIFGSTYACSNLLEGVTQAMVYSHVMKEDLDAIQKKIEMFDIACKSIKQSPTVEHYKEIVVTHKMPEFQMKYTSVTVMKEFFKDATNDLFKNI